MIPIESQALAEVMFWYAIGAIAFILVIAFFYWLGGKLVDTTLDSPEEQAAREAKRIARQASKEFKRRQRMRSVRFWNF